MSDDTFNEMADEILALRDKLAAAEEELDATLKQLQQAEERPERYREALERIDEIPWDSPASAQMRTISHFALQEQP